MNKIGQVWIETVIYTLIGLALMGFVLAISTPQINQMKDKAVIEQSIESLNVFDAAVDDSLIAIGNKRVVEFKMKKGSLTIDPFNNQIIYELEGSRAKFSEPGTTITEGVVKIFTEESGKDYNVKVTLAYPNYDLEYRGDEKETKFTQTSIPYKFSIENKGYGEDSDDPVVLEINEFS